MEILKHCKEYPLSQYYHTVPHSLNLQDVSDTTTTPKYSMHLIEPDFKMNEYKRQLVLRNYETGNTGAILIIDIISIWRQTLEETRFANIKYWYVNSKEISTIEGLICFLGRVNANPIVTLNKECPIRYGTNAADCSVDGIIIDNLSYLNTSDDFKSFNILKNMISNIQKAFGCWYISTSLNLEFSQGIEHSFYPKPIVPYTNYTAFPSNYLNDMNIVMVRDSSTHSKVIKN